MRGLSRKLVVVGVAIWLKVPVPVVLRETLYKVAPIDAVHEIVFCPSPGVTVTPVGGSGGTQAGVAETWAE